MRTLQLVYRIFRTWTDALINGGLSSNRLLVLIAFLPFLIALFATPFPSAAWLIAACFSLLWIGFVSWRGWRLMQTNSIKSARDYDRRAKFKLPPEYAASESLLAHRQRKRRSKR